MAMAVSGAAGPTATNRPPMDMKSRRGRQRRFGTGATTTKPFLMATRIEMPANHGHSIQHCRHLLLDMVANVSQPPPRGPLAILASGLLGYLNLRTPPYVCLDPASMT